MKIQKIYNKLVEQLKGDDDISITLKNGRIIISMKRDNKVWTIEQEKDLDRRFRESEDRIITSVVSQLKEYIDQAFEKHVNQYHK